MSAMKKVCALAKFAKLIQVVSTELCRKKMLDIQSSTKT
jgi:hypothetical protein